MNFLYSILFSSEFALTIIFTIFYFLFKKYYNKYKFQKELSYNIKEIDLTLEKILLIDQNLLNYPYNSIDSILIKNHVKTILYNLDSICSLFKEQRASILKSKKMRIYLSKINQYELFKSSIRQDNHVLNKNDLNIILLANHNYSKNQTKETKYENPHFIA